MSVRNRFLGVAAAAALAVSFTVPASGQAQERNYLLSTASTGGTYYPVGVALATLVKVKLQASQKINMSAISSAGSGENIKLLRDKEVQFAILQGLFGAWAWKGSGPIEKDGPQTHLRSISMLWPNVEHFVVNAADAKSGTIADFVALKGRKVSLGAKNSGTIGSNQVLLGNLGLDIEKDYELAYMGYGPSAEALQNGTIAGMSTPAGVPVGAVTQAFAAMGNKIALLGFTPEQVAKADGGFNAWVAYDIPAGTYPGVDKAITTLAQPNFLAVREDVPENDVYLITKAIFENLAFLNAIHSATKEMGLKSAIGGLPMPLHAGALKYFREAGLTVPAHLLAK